MRIKERIKSNFFMDVTKSENRTRRIVSIDTQSEDGDSHYDVTRVYLKQDTRKQEDLKYTETFYFQICTREEKEEKVVGELSGHYFDFKSLNKNKKTDSISPVINVLSQYDEETFEICQNLCKETNCIRGKGQNIFHLDRFYIQENYRGGGAGRQILYQFETQASYLLHHDIRYIALFPDPITEDLEYDSLYDMDRKERDIRIQTLKKFYGSLGFKEMKTKPDYMYVDLYHIKERPREKMLS